MALTHRQQLHLDQDEIEFVLNSYWRQLNADIESESTLDTQAIEPAIKLIIGYKTNEDFLLLLRRLSTQLDNMQRPETEAQHTSLQNILILLGLFSKCSLSSIKGAVSWSTHPRENHCIFFNLFIPFPDAQRAFRAD